MNFSARLEVLTDAGFIKPGISRSAGAGQRQRNRRVFDKTLTIASCLDAAADPTDLYHPDMASSSLSNYKQTILNDFNSRCGDSSFHKQFASRLVELAKLKEGDAVLDVATGTGLAAIAAVEVAGTKGYVLGTDFAVGALTSTSQG